MQDSPFIAASARTTIQARALSRLHKAKPALACVEDGCFLYSLSCHLHSLNGCRYTRCIACMRAKRCPVCVQTCAMSRTRHKLQIHNIQCTYPFLWTSLKRSVKGTKGKIPHTNAPLPLAASNVTRVRMLCRLCQSNHLALNKETPQKKTYLTNRPASTRKISSGLHMLLTLGVHP